METRLLTLYSTSNFILSQNSKFLGVNPFPDKVHRQTPEPLSSLARLLELLENGTICTGHPTSSAVQPSAPTSVAMRFVADRPWPTSRKPPPPFVFPADDEECVHPIRKTSVGCSPGEQAVRRDENIIPDAVGAGKNSEGRGPGSNKNGAQDSHGENRQRSRSVMKMQVQFIPWRWQRSACREGLGCIIVKRLRTSLLLYCTIIMRQPDICKFTEIPSISLSRITVPTRMLL